MRKSTTAIIILLILIFLFLIVAEILISYQEYHLSYNVGQFKKSVRNFESSPIYNLTLTNPGECKKLGGVKKIVYTYPGTTRGYYCHSKFKGINCDSNYVCEKCSSDNKRTIKATNEYDISNWRTKEICQLEADKYPKYANILSKTVESNSQCPSGKKQCGILDSFGRLLCLDSNEECPINYVTISDCDNPPEVSFTSSENLKKLEFYENSDVTGISKCLFYSNENTNEGKIIAHFEASEISSVCPYWQDKASNRKQFYKLEKYVGNNCKRTVNGKNYDDRYDLIDKTTINDFYIQSGLAEHVMSLRGFLEYYYSIETENAYLFTTNFYGINKNDMSEVYKNAVDSQKNNDDAQKMYKPCFIISTIILIIDILSFYFIATVLPFLFFGFNYILLLPILIMECIAINKYNSINKVKPCSDDITNANFDDLVNSIKKQRNFIISIVSMISFYYGCSIICIFIIKLKDKNKCCECPCSSSSSSSQRILKRIKTVKTFFKGDDPAPPEKPENNNNCSNEYINNNGQIQKPFQEDINNNALNANAPPNPIVQGNVFYNTPDDYNVQNVNVNPENNVPDAYNVQNVNVNPENNTPDAYNVQNVNANPENNVPDAYIQQNADANFGGNLDLPQLGELNVDIHAGVDVNANLGGENNAQGYENVANNI